LWGASRMDDGDLHLRYALFLLKTGVPADAVEMYKEALDRMPDEEKKVVPGKFDSKNIVANPAERQKFEAAARTALGLRLLALEATDDAAAQFEAALKLAPNTAAAQLGLGRIHRLKGRKGEAMVALQKAADGGDGTVRDMAKKAIEEYR
jgi:Tfp pilus assembly protein PilF